MLDVIHGYKTIYPIPLAMGATFAPELLKDCSKMAAREYPNKQNNFMFPSQQQASD